MANRIALLHSTVAGRRPTGGAPGEAWVNLADGLLGYFDASGNAVAYPPGRIQPHDPARAYATDDLILDGQGRILRAIHAVAAGPFVAADWAHAFVDVRGDTMDGALTIRTPANAVGLVVNESGSGSPLVEVGKGVLKLTGGITATFPQGSGWAVGFGTPWGSWEWTHTKFQVGSNHNAFGLFYNPAANQMTFTVDRAPIDIVNQSPTLTGRNNGSEGSWGLGLASAIGDVAKQNWRVVLGSAGKNGVPVDDPTRGITVFYADANTAEKPLFSVTGLTGNAVVAGTVTSAGTVLTSAEQIKDGIEQAPSMLAAVTALPVKRFVRKVEPQPPAPDKKLDRKHEAPVLTSSDEPDASEEPPPPPPILPTRQEIGFLAHEVAAVLPEAVTRDADGNPAGIYLNDLLAASFKAIQELAAKVAALEARQA